MMKSVILFLSLVSCFYVKVDSSNTVNLIVSPVDTEAKAGKDVVLECWFDRDASRSCNWLLNRASVTLNFDRYFLNGNATLGDCSLKISQVAQVDVGNWTCEFKATSISQAAVSNPVRLTIKEGLSAGAIAGIVIGCLAFVAIVAVVTVLLVKHKKKGDRELSASYTKGKPVKSHKHSEHDVESHH